MPSQMYKHISIVAFRSTINSDLSRASIPTTFWNIFYLISQICIDFGFCTNFPSDQFLWIAICEEIFKTSCKVFITTPNLDEM